MSIEAPPPPERLQNQPRGLDAGQESPTEGTPIVNDVVIAVATSNGTGSQSANLILMRTIFQMGVPVSGKNMFPSNIQGLPTWFTIRANKDGWVARRARTDVMVAMNSESIVDDIKSLEPGAILILNEDLKQFLNRDDLNVYIIPFSKLVVPVCPDAKLRRLVINMIYVGVVAWMLQLDLEELKTAMARQFKSKPKAAELNANAAMAGYQWAAENCERQQQFVIRPMEATRNKIIIEGNMAAALGLMFGGITVLAWYPITPSSSICEYLQDFMHKYRHDADGKATYAIVQAEDELASMAMVVGAGWCGARSATTTSGPGISLMAELAGLSYFAEIPAVIIDVQRMGPSTGLPTRTCQGDMMKAYFLSHGDCKHPLLIPATPEEAYELTMLSLNLSEKLQTLVFVMLDLDLGMNNWMSDPFKAPQIPIERGKVLNAEDLEKLNGNFARYRDVDGDAIPYRTLPGTHHPNAAFYTRGTGHTDRATYSEKPEDWQSNMDRLARKFETAREMMPKPILQTEAGAKIAIIAYGTSHGAVEEARFLMRQEQKAPTDYLRLLALPPGKEVREFIESREYVYVLDQNRDSQVASILRMEYPDLSPRIRSIRHYDGIPIDARSIVNEISNAERKQ